MIITLLCIAILITGIILTFIFTTKEKYKENKKLYWAGIGPLLGGFVLSMFTICLTVAPLHYAEEKTTTMNDEKVRIVALIEKSDKSEEETIQLEKDIKTYNAKIDHEKNLNNAFTNWFCYQDIAKLEHIQY